LFEGNSESIGCLEAKVETLLEQSQRTDIKLDRLSDVILGNYRNIVRVETATNHNEGAWLDVLERINALERRIEAMENSRSN